MFIKELFDPKKDIYRSIEKVITYNASQESRLRAEITEYIATEHINEQFEKLLSRMEMAMSQGGGNEVGVWVSGFYGSGKSSFTKYLGLALDEDVKVDGVRFLTHLQNRLNRATTKALLNKVASRYSAAVVLLDLASEMLAGATMEEVSTVLYYKVLQWAGFSRNLKVAAFERRLQKDDRYQDFLDYFPREFGLTWSDIQNDPLTVDSIIPAVAHEFYPEVFKTPTAFNTATEDIVRFENERVSEMIDIAREKTGKQYIIFIIDEVGQYVAARPNLILNLDGLAKNLKEIGDGKVWIVATAQQTLTEDDQRAALNSPELYKLKDRFPIQVELVSNDIKEISYKRLLGKSSDGEALLSSLFDKHGQALRHNTKLQDARSYDADFDRTTFINLYPFLPAHFEVLLRLLSALAKSTGGIGLRSAIKIIQDILVEGPDGRTPVANQPVGWLATTVTLYDVLERDIERAAPSIHKAVGKAWGRFPYSPAHQDVAKTVAILQILGSIPVTAQNITSLMHPDISVPSRRDEVDSALRDLSNDPFVPFGEKEGNLCFFSEKLNDIDQERAQLPLRSIETRRIQNEALREMFSPLPSARIQNTLAVSTGLRVFSGGQPITLAGERETVQTLVELVDPQDYDTARARLVDESRQRSARHTIYLIGRTAPEIDDKVAEIYRCREIAQRYRNDPDQEIKDYCKGQTDRANRLIGELVHLLRRLLGQGSFIFRGQTTAVDSLDHNLLDAAKKHLADVAAQVFDRYAEAPIRAETAIAEKFLRAGNLKAINSQIDPLGLVQVNSGTPQIKTTEKALVSIRDYIDHNGTVDGKGLTDYFTDAPFGWSPDTLRYLVAALLWAGEIKLKVSGREVKVNGQQAIDALRTNNTFKPVGVALRAERPSNEVLARAAERMTDLVGDMVIPLEDEISNTATKHFPQFQLRYGPLVTKLEALGLPGVEKIGTLNQDLADMLQTDASDATQRLGGVDSPLFERLKWAADVDRALKNDLEKTVREIQQHRQEIETLPASGVPGQLRNDVAESLDQIGQRLRQESFYHHAADLSSALTTIKARVRDAVQQMIAVQQEALKETGQDFQRLLGWVDLNQSEQSSTLAQLEELAISPSTDLRGLKQLLSHGYEIQSRVREIKKRVEQLSHQRQLDRLREEQERVARESQESTVHELRPKLARTVKLPASLRSASRLDELIQQLQALRSELTAYSEIDVTIEVGD
jgi:uncharacterized protein DUF6079